jgi:hypothetical protein
MGIAFNYDDGTYRHAGLFRDSSDGIFKVFEGYEPEPVSPINTSDATYSDARFQAESLILTQATGIAPMSVSSSTVVTNLNADKLDGQDGLYYAPIDSPTFTGTVSLPNNTVALGTQTTGNYVARCWKLFVSDFCSSYCTIDWKCNWECFNCYKWRLYDIINQCFSRC